MYPARCLYQARFRVGLSVMTLTIRHRTLPVGFSVDCRPDQDRGVFGKQARRFAALATCKWQDLPSEPPNWRQEAACSCLPLVRSGIWLTRSLSEVGILCTIAAYLGGPRRFIYGGREMGGLPRAAALGLKRH